jgi:hypothetical protein
MLLIYCKTVNVNVEEVRLSYSGCGNICYITKGITS